jgi:hypothetical protein
MGLLEFLHLKKKELPVPLPPIPKPDSFKPQVPEIPVFNIQVSEEHRIDTTRLQESGFQEGSKLLGDCVVYSNGLVVPGHIETLKNYEASLERYSDGTPENLHFNCELPVNCSYPYRVFKDEKSRFRLTLLSIGHDPVKFGEKHY